MTTFSSETYIAEIERKPNDITAFALIWNSAATISNPETRCYRGGVDVSATVLTGSNSSATNIQTGKVLTIPESYAGSVLVYEFRTDIEGKTLNKWLHITVSELPRA